MPQRATSRGLLHIGIGLLLVACLLVVGLVLWDRPAMSDHLAASQGELDRIVNAINEVRDTIDDLRESRLAQREYLLTGSPAERTALDTLVAQVADSIDQHKGDPDTAQDVQFDGLVQQLLADLQRGAALQNAGQHDAAVAASRIDASRTLMAKIDTLTRSRIVMLRGRYQDVVTEVRDARDLSEQFAHVMFSLAGASFALGCISLIVYLRRHTAVERALRSGRDAALEASIMKSRFIATASHDLRQPLHAISMFVGVLRRRTNDPAVLAVVENVATAVASMQRMFAALLDVARLDAGAVKVAPHSVALQPLLRALEVEFVPSATAKGLSLQIQPTPFSVSTDPALLETILRNLLSNAIKFTDHGAVGVITRRHEAAVEITVFDTGIGIAPEDQPTIFGQFERLPQPGSMREGLGLGLSIVQRMAELLGTAVTIDSERGNGARFSLLLPLAAPASVDEGIVTTGPEPDLGGHRILVLDDHAEARKAIAMAVETLGGVPLEASSPDAAFSALATAPGPPQAAVVDHDLGGGHTGPDFLDAYAERYGHPLPAVIITGSTEASTLATLSAGGRPWLIKPVDLDVLRLTLTRLVASVTVV